MNADIPYLVAVAFVFCLLVIAALGLIWPGKKAKKPPPSADVPANEPDTPLARLVWAAHVANQELDQAIMTGGAADLRRADTKAALANNNLYRHLNARKEEQ